MKVLNIEIAKLMGGSKTIVEFNASVLNKHGKCQAMRLNGL